MVEYGRDSCIQKAPKGILTNRFREGRRREASSKLRLGERSREPVTKQIKQFSLVSN